MLRKSCDPIISAGGSDMKPLMIRERISQIGLVLFAVALGFWLTVELVSWLDRV
jgi:hypothetical protein